MPPGLVLPTVFTAIDRFTAPIMRMRGALGSFVTFSQVGLARMERGFRKMISPLADFQNMLRGLGLYIGLFSALLILRNAVNIMADFEQAQVNIAAVTGKSVRDNKALADQARVLALRYGEAAKSVLDLDLALIKAGYSESDVMKMSAPILTGSVALKATPEELGKTVNAVLGAFKMDPSQTQGVVDLMAKAADLSTMDWSDLQTMLPRAAQSAALAGMSFKELLSLFAAARNAQVHVASGSVAIKNMLISGAIHGKTFNEMLDKIIASPNAIKKAYKMFGQRTLVTALPLAEARKLGSTEDFLQKLNAQFDGYAEQVARMRLMSIRGSITLVKRSWEELIISVEDGTGPVGKSLRQWLDVGSAMLLYASASDAAISRLREMDTSTLALADTMTTWLKVIGYGIALLIAMKLALIAWNVVLVAGKIILGAWSIALGVAAAMGLVNLRVIAGNTIAAGAYRAAVWLATAAQWAWNAAMTANPIGLIIVAIASLAAWITIIINKWDEWGALASLTLGVVGMQIGLVMTIMEHWSRITEAFVKGGLIAGIKAVGKAILDFMLYPLQQFYELASRVPGLEGLGDVAKFIEQYRNSALRGMSAAPVSDESGGSEVVRPDKSDMQDQWKEFMGKVSIDINNKSGFPMKTKSEGGVTVNLTPQSTFDDF